MRNQAAPAALPPGLGVPRRRVLAAVPLLAVLPVAGCLGHGGRPGGGNGAAGTPDPDSLARRDAGGLLAAYAATAAAHPDLAPVCDAFRAAVVAGLAALPSATPTGRPTPTPSVASTGSAPAGTAAQALASLAAAEGAFAAGRRAALPRLAGATAAAHGSLAAAAAARGAVLGLLTGTTPAATLGVVPSPGPTP